ncbi:MAG: kelch repeat-containing protein, partial [Bacteroidota bacterium]
HHLQPIVYQEKIYVMGALTGKYPGETPIPNIYIYHPAEDRWEKSTAIPTDRQRGAAGVALYKGKMYMACGIRDGHRGDHKKWLDVFDPASAKWETLPDAPRARDHFQAIAAKDQLFLLGGRTTIAADNPFKNTITEVDVYNFKTGQWKTLEQGLPTQRAGNYASLVGNEILVMGGESFFQEASHAETEAINVSTLQWRSLAPMLQGRHGTGAVLHQGKIYVASGSGNRGGGPELITLEYFEF